VGNYLHAQDYMVYAHLQLAQNQQARAVIDEMLKETDFKAAVAAADYALAASPARYAIDRGDWDAASQLSVRPSGLNFAMAVSHFARALGAARSGKKSIHIFFPPQDGIVKDCGILLKQKLRPVSGAFPPRSLGINDSAKLAPLDPAAFWPSPTCVCPENVARRATGVFCPNQSPA
jgi:hypothetical protein